MHTFQTLVLKAKEDVYSLLQGSNFSKILGQGYDFAELRPYAQGDDVRYISWVNSAKLGEPYVKRMHEERELLVHVSLIIDGRSIIGQKHQLFTYLLALFSYSTVLSNNLFETSFCIGASFKGFEATKEIEAVERCIDEFSNIKPLGLKIAYEKIAHKLVALERKKSLLFLIGDFLEEIDLSLLSQKHELCIIIVRDRWEEKPLINSDEVLINPITKKNINKNFSKKSLEYYRKKLVEHDEKLYAHFNQHKIKYVKIYEQEEALEKIERLFNF